jgi:integrase/recombinase XerD
MSIEFDEIVDEFVRRRTVASTSDAESTGKRYARDIRNQWKPWLEEEYNVTVWEAETGHVASYLRHLDQEDYAKATIKLRLSAISKFYQGLWQMAQEPGYVLPDLVEERFATDEVENREDANPVTGIRREDYGLAGTSKTKKADGLAGRDDVPYLTPDEVQELEEAVPAPQVRNVLIIRLLFTTGVRRQELAKIRVDGIYRDDRIIEVPAVKSDEGRRVVYPPSIEDLFNDWLDLGGRVSVPDAGNSPYLLPTERRDHISPKRVNTVVKEAAENAGLQETINEYADGRSMSRITAHTLRHSYGVQAVKSDIDVRTIQLLMGHSDIQTTERYLRIAEDDLIDRARRFDPGFSV